MNVEAFMDLPEQQRAAVQEWLRLHDLNPLNTESFVIDGGYVRAVMYEVDPDTGRFVCGDGGEPSMLDVRVRLRTDPLRFEG